MLLLYSGHPNCQLGWYTTTPGKVQMYKVVHKAAVVRLNLSHDSYGDSHDIHILHFRCIYVRRNELQTFWGMISWWTELGHDVWWWLSKCSGPTLTSTQGEATYNPMLHTYAPSKTTLLCKTVARLQFCSIVIQQSSFFVWEYVPCFLNHRYLDCKVWLSLILCMRICTVCFLNHTDIAMVCFLVIIFFIVFQSLSR